MSDDRVNNLAWLFLGLYVLFSMMSVLTMHSFDKARDTTETLEARITKLERSIPIPPLTTEEAVELMEGLN